MKNLKLFFAALLGSFLIFLTSFGSAHAQPTPTPVPQSPLCVAGQLLDLFDDVDACNYFANLLERQFQAPAGGSPWYSQTPQEFSQKVFGGNPDEVFGERYTYAQINWILNSLLTMVNPTAGSQSPADTVILLKSLNDLLSYAPQSGNSSADLANAPKTGVLGLFMNVAGYMYTHPAASGVAETKKTISSAFGFVPSASAQGIGFAKLSGGNIRNLWSATRNMAYLMIVILLVASGFMVMFRTKISPQASVTAQMILPKLVVASILIAFSYAIAGFVIDMIYVAISAILSLLFLGSNGSFFSPGADGLPYSISILTGDYNFVAAFLAIPIILALIALVLLFILAPLLTITFVDAASAAFLIPWLVPLIAMAFGLVAWSLYVAARIIGQLLMAYLSIILLTISGPLQIMFDVLPGDRKIGFKPWIMCLIGNASVFVTYVVLAVVGKALFRFGWGSNDLGFNLDVTSISTQMTLPLANFANPVGNWLIWILLGMAYFQAVPNIVTAVKDMFCKGDDYSKSLEGLVKDTVGQLNKAGQGASDASLKRLQGQADDARKAANDAANTTLGTPAERTSPNARG